MTLRCPGECEWDRLGGKVLPDGQGEGRREQIGDRLLPPALHAQAPRPGTQINCLVDFSIEFSIQFLMQ